MAEDNPAPRILPIELSSVVASIETITRELTKKLTPEETAEVVESLCERLRLMANDRRRPDRPFTS